MTGVKFFRRLAVATAIFAYLQIALGGVVRVSGSGLGCPDWPLCHGRPYPPADVHAIVEYSHRAVGSVTGVVVVVNDLASWLVLIHLGLAMIILGALVATAVMSMPASPGVADPRFRRIAAIAVGATYLLLLTGSTVVASGADTACRAWPLCGAGLTPDFAGVNAFTMLHRGSVLVIGALLVFVLLRAARLVGLRVVAIATLAVFAMQVAVGAGAAITDASFFNGLHVALATLLWAGTLATAMLTLPRVDRDAQPSRMVVQKGSA
jgi:heme A synthase